eukprot:7331633-Prorocentrum_lima.AAC.1
MAPARNQPNWLSGYPICGASAPAARIPLPATLPWMRRLRPPSSSTRLPALRRLAWLLFGPPEAKLSFG